MQIERVLALKLRRIKHFRHTERERVFKNRHRRTRRHHHRHMLRRWRCPLPPHATDPLLFRSGLDAFTTSAVATRDGAHLHAGWGGG